MLQKEVINTDCGQIGRSKEEGSQIQNKTNFQFEIVQIQISRSKQSHFERRKKQRNNRDNLFVINAITNTSKQNKDEKTDIIVYDMIKCFDSLWLSECINNLYKSGLRNDKQVLLYESNQTANIVVKHLAEKQINSS